MSDVWIPIFIALTIISTVTGYFYFTHKTKEALQKTIRAAIDKGSELSPDLITKLATPNDPKEGDLRKAIIIGMIALAIASIVRLMDDDPEMLALAILPAFLSLGYFILWKFTYNKD